MRRGGLVLVLLLSCASSTADKVVSAPPIVSGLHNDTRIQLSETTLIEQRKRSLVARVRRSFAHHASAAAEHSSYVAAIAQRSGKQLWRSRNVAAALLARFRLVAFTSEFGESFRPLMALWKVQMAYAVSWAYVILDVLLRAADELALRGRTFRVLRTLLFFSVFHSVATMLLPALVIHSSVHYAEVAVHALLPTAAPAAAAAAAAATTTAAAATGAIAKGDALRLAVRKWLPSVVGLMLIPLMPLLDEPAEHLLEHLFQRAWPLSRRGAPKPALLTDYEVAAALEAGDAARAAGAAAEEEGAAASAPPTLETSAGDPVETGYEAAPVRGNEEPELQRATGRGEPEYVGSSGGGAPSDDEATVRGDAAGDKPAVVGGFAGTAASTGLEPATTMPPPSQGSSSA
jgi:hypothetical protein